MEAFNTLNDGTENSMSIRIGKTKSQISNAQKKRELALKLLEKQKLRKLKQNRGNLKENKTFSKQVKSIWKIKRIHFLNTKNFQKKLNQVWKNIFLKRRLEVESHYKLVHRTFERTNKGNEHFDVKIETDSSQKYQIESLTKSINNMVSRQTIRNQLMTFDGSSYQNGPFFILSSSFPMKPVDFHQQRMF